MADILNFTRGKGQDSKCNCLHHTMVCSSCGNADVAVGHSVNYNFSRIPEDVIEGKLSTVGLSVHCKSCNYDKNVTLSKFDGLMAKFFRLMRFPVSAHFWPNENGCTGQGGLGFLPEIEEDLIKMSYQLKTMQIEILQDALAEQTSQTLQPDWPAEKQEQLDKALDKLRSELKRLHYQQDPPGPIE